MVSPEEIYEFATSLMTAEPLPEINARQAAARAYYSVLHVAKARAGVEAGPGASSHQVIYDALFQLRSKGLLEAGYWDVLNYWSSLKDARILAEYKIAEDFDPIKARKSLGYAKRIFDGLKPKAK